MRTASEASEAFSLSTMSSTEPPPDASTEPVEGRVAGDVRYRRVQQQ